MTTWDPVPGTFDHRGMDCRVHGENVEHARLRDAHGPFNCVRCMLEICKRVEEEDARPEDRQRAR
jgi:hypothetical protein